jgi:hypothetical protein
MADRIAGDEVRRELVDNRCDHRIHVGDPVMPFEVTASKGFEADAIGGIQVAVCGQIRAPRGAVCGSGAELIAEAVRRIPSR